MAILLSSFQGRINRTTFLQYYLVVILLTVLDLSFDKSLFHNLSHIFTTVSLSVLVYWTLTLTAITLSWKRLQDCNIPGVIAPLLSSIFLILVIILHLWIFTVFQYGYLFFLLLRKGTPGDNQFGKMPHPAWLEMQKNRIMPKSNKKLFSAVGTVLILSLFITLIVYFFLGISSMQKFHCLIFEQCSAAMNNAVSPLPLFFVFAVILCIFIYKSFLNKHKLTTTILVSIALLVLVSFCLLVYWVSQLPTDKNSIQTVQKENPVLRQYEYPSVDHDTANWKVYTDTSLHFTVRYPPNFILTTNPKDKSVTFMPPNATKKFQLAKNDSLIVTPSISLQWVANDTTTSTLSQSLALAARMPYGNRGQTMQHEPIFLNQLPVYRYEYLRTSQRDIDQPMLSSLVIIQSTLFHENTSSYEITPDLRKVSDLIILTLHVTNN